MARVYRLPQFNVLAGIWHNELPADLTDWNGLRPSREPDIITACQLYLPRWTTGLWGHALSNSASETHLKAGFQELRVPKTVQVKTRWGVAEGMGWELSALVEVPLSSGRLYVACIGEIRHVGFINEYNAVFLAQLKYAGGAGALASGSGMTAGTVHGVGTAGIGSGSAMSAVLSTHLHAASLASGSAGVNLSSLGNAVWALTSGSAGRSLAALGGATWLVTSGSSLANVAALGGATWLVTSGTNMQRLGTLTVANQQCKSGSAVECVSTTHEDEPPDDGPECGTFTEVLLPHVQEYTIPANAEKLLRFSGGFGQTYRVKATGVSGGTLTGFLAWGPCPDFTSQVDLTGSPLCASATIGPSTVIWARYKAGASGPVTFTADIALGTC